MSDDRRLLDLALEALRETAPYAAAVGQGLVGFTIVALRVEVDDQFDDWWVLTLNDGREVHIRRSDKDPGWVWVDPNVH